VKNVKLQIDSLKLQIDSDGNTKR